MSFWRILQWVLAVVATLLIIGLAGIGPSVDQQPRSATGSAAPSSPDDAAFRNMK